MLTAATNLSANTAGSGAVFISQTGVVTLANSAAGSGFTLTSSAATTLNNLFIAGDRLTSPMPAGC